MLGPSYGAAIFYPPPINAAWSVMLEGAAFECGLYRAILGTYSKPKSCPEASVLSRAKLPCITNANRRPDGAPLDRRV
jgi:hypothetical protein